MCFTKEKQQNAWTFLLIYHGGSLYILHLESIPPEVARRGKVEVVTLRWRAKLETPFFLRKHRNKKKGLLNSIRSDVLKVMAGAG